jgi:hypothetical protein
MTDVDDRIDRIIERIHQIDEEIHGLYDLKRTAHRSGWSVTMDDRLPSMRITEKWIPRDKPRIVGLTAERSKLNEMLIRLSAEKAESHIGISGNPQPRLIPNPQRTSEAISWCVRTYKERKSNGQVLSQSGIAGEAMRECFPDIPEYTGKQGRTRKQLKNKEWLLKRDCIRISFLQKLPSRRKKK